MTTSDPAAATPAPHRRPTHLLAWVGWATLFAGILAVQAVAVRNGDADAAPPVNDAMEVCDIGWNLAHGHGYAFGWDDADFRQLWAGRNDRGQLTDMLAHHGGPHPTLSRPPLMPLLVAGLFRLGPRQPFLAWRLFDAAAFAAAAVVLARATGRRYGPYAVAILVALLLLDPLRPEFVPGWWTEGLAFDGVAVLTALLLTAPTEPEKPRRYVRGSRLLCVAVTLGLLCLDRSAFVVLLPVWAATAGWAVARGWRRQLAAAAAVLAVAAAVQVPWWARNVAVAGRFLPLGTQAGLNLADEYGDEAVRYAGWWNGMATARVWAAARPAPGGPAPVAPAVAALWPGAPTYAALIHAETCESTATEIAVADAGRRAGLAWLRSHPRRLPGLFVAKVRSETIAHRPWLASLLTAGAVGLAAARDRRPLWALLALTAAYTAGIGLTHAVLGRFLVPILPALYVPAAAAGPAIARRAPPGRRPAGRRRPHRRPMRSI